MLPSLSPHEFVDKWRKAALKERSAAQEHFIDLCHLVGHPTPAEADPTGQAFTFEAGATKQRGGQGWADVWKKRYFAWEYKGKHKDLDQAYQQLLQYRESLLNPPLLIVSDMEQIVVHTNFTNTVKQVVEIGLDDLLTPDGLAQLRALFYEPETFRTPQTTEEVTQEAASEFARLADLLRKYGEEPQAVAHFLIRLLFCLFAEDIGLLPKDLFTRLVEGTQKRPSAFAGQLRQLFQAMISGGWFGVDEIANFDGKLFDDDSVLELDSDGQDILARVSTLDWSNIEPSIFGTLFERSLDPSKRSQLGAHYTSKEDIMLIVEPVLMAPLRRRWDEVRQEALDLARRRDEAKTKRTRNSRQKDLTNLLTGFAYEIAQVQVLDPACGSGNFLYVALKQLLDLEKEVVTFASDIGMARFFPSVSPVQLHGIEVNPYAHELAQATIWIGYIQWLQENGFGVPSEPILKPLDTILQMDAILACDEQGQPVEPEWPGADVIVGNPPFLGGSKLRRELGDEYVGTLWNLYDGKVARTSDLVMYWFERAWNQISSGQAKRVGLLSTQAIRSPINRNVLEKIVAQGSLFLAWSDRPWILDGASVRVSMIGFDNGDETIRFLDGKPVDKINVTLTAGKDLTLAKRLGENKELSFQGSMIGGKFQVPEDLAQSWLNLSNPNGQSNTDVLRPYVTGSDVLRKSSKEWIIDFGSAMPIEQAAGYEQPFEHVKEHVYPKRAKNPRASRRERWWIHADPQPSMRKAIQDLGRYIATVRVAKHRVFVWLPQETLCSNKLIVIARNDDYFFGVLHSRIHEIWSLSNSSRHGVGNDPAYTPSTTFETFPFPWPPGQEPTDNARVQAVAQAARELVEKRDRWLNPEGATEKELKKHTLTNLYNQRPTWLDLAHQKLDRAVLDAYGWPYDLSDEEILERLLALNLERAGA
jgi:type II restriction/modification system DNA methylase subunit YeeA